MTITHEWDRHSILAELHRRHMTLAELAKAYQIPPYSMAAIWRRPNEKAERAIADSIDLPVETIFSDRCPKNRNRIFKAEKHCNMNPIAYSLVRNNAP